MSAHFAASSKLSMSSLSLAYGQCSDDEAADASIVTQEDAGSWINSIRPAATPSRASHQKVVGRHTKYTPVKTKEKRVLSEKARAALVEGRKVSRRSALDVMK